jgi:hypothetical protein
MHKTSPMLGMLVSALAYMAAPARADRAESMWYGHQAPRRNAHWAIEMLPVRANGSAAHRTAMGRLTCSGEPTPSDKLDLRNIRAKPPTAVFTPAAPPKKPAVTKAPATTAPATTK